MKNRHPTIGLQTSVTGRYDGLGSWINAATASGIPMFMAASDALTGIADLMMARENTGVMHNANFILTEDVDGNRLGMVLRTDFATNEEAHQAYQADAIDVWDRALASPVFPNEIKGKWKQWVTVSLENEQRPYVGWGPKTDLDAEEWKHPIVGFEGWGDVLGWQAYYRAKEALRRGYMYMALAFAGGNPEEGYYSSPGMVKFLTLCHDNWRASDHGPIGLALHEYSLTQDLTFEWGDRIGRFQHVHEVCDSLRIHRPRIQIKEFGWTLWEVPVVGDYWKSQILLAAELYCKYENIDGAAIWTAAGGWGQASNVVPTYITPLQEITLAYTFPVEEAPPVGGPVDPPIEPPIEPPTVPETHVANSCFDQGWTDFPPTHGSLINQQPIHWTVEWLEIGDPVHMPIFGLEYREADGTKYGAIVEGVPEMICKLNSQLSPAQQMGGVDALVLCGDPESEDLSVYKVFHRGASFGVTLTPDITSPFVVGARYLISIPVRIHWHCGDTPDLWNAAMIFLNGDNERVIVRGDQIGDEEWTIINLQFVYTGGEVRFQLASLYPGCATDWFIDNVNVELIADPMPPVGDISPPTRVNRRTHLLPQDTSNNELSMVTQYLHPEKSEFTYSADAAHSDVYMGKSDPEKNFVTIWDGHRWPDDIFSWMDVRNIPWVSKLFSELGGPVDPPPSTGFRLLAWPTNHHGITQWWNRNPENYPLWSGGHEGNDVVSPLGEPYYSAVNGRVIKVSNLRSNGSVSLYGWHVIVDSLDENGERHGYSLLYAHAQPNPPVSVGQIVTAGQIIAYSGNTGNTSGPHEHLTIKQDGAQSEGFPPGYIDPWPYLAPLQDEWLNQNGRYGFVWANSIDRYMDYGAAQGGLNLRATSTGGEILGVVPSNSVVKILGEVEGTGYYPVLAYATGGGDGPPPTSGNATMSLNLRADPTSITEAEYAEFVTLGETGEMKMVKVLSAHPRHVVEKLHQDQTNIGNTGLFWVVRAFLSFVGGRVISPEQFVKDTKDDMLRTINVLLEKGTLPTSIGLEVHNESNLEPEGLWHSWADGREFNDWGLAVMALYKEIVPAGVKFVYPGLSPGSDTNIRQGHETFFRQSKQFAMACDIVGVHAYWQNDHATWPMSTAVAVVDWFIAEVGNKPIIVTEASNNRKVDVPEPGVYAQDYVDFWQFMRQRPTVMGAAWFVASGTDFPEEAWITEVGVSKGIAALIKDLIL